MAIINELEIGVDTNYNGMVMFRKYDSQRGFVPTYIFVDDNTLSLDSNIVVNYVEYFKNSDNNVVKQLTQYKNYVVGNRAATYKTQLVTPDVYYEVGEDMGGNISDGTQIKTPAVYYEVNEDMGGGNLSDGTQIKTPAVYYEVGESMGANLSDGTQIKTPAVYETVVDVPEWLGANGWFLSMARTPIFAPYGIMDGIESTLMSLPMGVPSGYILTGPL